jgi:predicted dehydrogenase
VDLATPPHLHAEQTIAAVEAGKHVHCEKPFCRFTGEGLRACEAARKRRVHIAVGETYVFLSSHMKARELIDSGEIGRPLQIRQRHGAWIEREPTRIPIGPLDRGWRVNPRKSGGGAYPWIFDHAVHFFATAEYLMPGARVQEIFAVAARSAQGTRRHGAAHDPYESTEVDIPIITWRYDDHSRQGVWMRAERLNGKYDFMRGFSTSVIGEAGMIEVLGEGGGNLFWQGEPQHLILHREGAESVCYRFDEGGDDVWESEISYYSVGHINQVAHFLDCVSTGRQARYTAEDGVHAVRCTLATIRSAVEERPVRVDEIDETFTAY